MSEKGNYLIGYSHIMMTKIEEKSLEEHYNMFREEFGKDEPKTFEEFEETVDKNCTYHEAIIGIEFLEKALQLVRKFAPDDIIKLLVPDDGKPIKIVDLDETVKTYIAQRVED